MTEVQRGPEPREVGHRYAPRTVRPKYMDVRPSGRSLFVVSKEQPVIVSVSKESTIKHDVTPASNIHGHVHPTEVAHVPSYAHHSKAKPALPRQKPSLVLRRQINDHAIQFRKKSRDQRSRTLLAFSFGGVAASLIISGIFIAYAVTHNKPQVLGSSYVPNIGGAGTNAQSASEQAVTQADILAFSVPKTAPRIIRIPKLSLQARIYSVKTNLSGDVTPTSNIFDVSWLESSARPGASGAALLAGFTAGASKDGAFARLDSLTVGDPIQIELGDGTLLAFKIISSKHYDSDKVDMSEATTSALPGTPGLNLLTNTGRYDVRTNKFEQRTIMFAVLE